MKNKNHSLIVTGGGTGGHVFAGISIAEAWRKTYPQAKITFVGAEGGIEERLVPRAGIPLEMVRLGSLKGVSIQKRIKTMLQIPLSLFHAMRIIWREKPAAVIGVGGYASGPVVLMARFLSIFLGTRVAILEQNAVPGFTNRILGHFSHLVLCAFSGIEKRFQGANTLVTGNPVRKEMVPLLATTQDSFTIFIFGGSQGALGINTLVLDALPHLQDLKPRLRFIHQTGQWDLERVQKGYKAAGFEGRIEKFLYEMKAAYQEANLIICRAGSSTLAEIAAVQRAAILIPFPQASDNHQEMNARLFVDKNAAMILLQQKATGVDLAQKIRSLIQKPEEIRQIEKNVATFYRPEAAQDIVRALND